MNRCLAHSSVGFYQVSKLGCIPVTILLEKVFKLSRQSLTLSLSLSLVLVVAGLAMTVQEEIVADSEGVLWAVLGIAVTSGAQVFFAPLQRELGLDSLQLLFHTSPWLLCGAAMSTTLFENVPDLLQFRFSSPVVMGIALSCALAALFNVSNYHVLSAVSPVTYILVGHAKTVLVMLAGVLYLDSLPSLRMCAGVVLAMLGVTAYKWELDRQHGRSPHSSEKSLSEREKRRPVNV